MNHHESTSYWAGKPPAFLQVLLLEVVKGALPTMAGGVSWLVGIAWGGGSKWEDEADEA